MPSSSSSRIVAGLRQAVASQPEARELRDWLALAEGSIGFEQWWREELKRDQLSFLSLDTTAACDLACSMCYFHPDIALSRPAAPAEKFEQAIADAQERLGLKNLIFSGKEPMLNPGLLLRLLAFARSLRDRRPRQDFRTGIITNGRHLTRVWNDLEQLSRAGALDFLDISLDSGLPEEHDAIRRQTGAFAATAAALAEAAKRLPRTRVGVNSVLLPGNGPGLLQLLRRMHEQVRCFFIIPVQPPAFAPGGWLDAATLIGFCRELRGLLAADLAGAGLEVTIWSEGYYLHRLEAAGFWHWSGLRENDEGMLGAGHEIAGNLLLFRVKPLPEYGHRMARLLHTGAYLAHAHFIETPNPDAHAVGFIQDEPIYDLYRRGKASGSLFAALTRSRPGHDCRNRACWVNCFGGWSVAEQALLYGQKFEERPLLCTSPGDIEPESECNVLPGNIVFNPA